MSVCRELSFPGGARAADDSPWAIVDDEILTEPAAKRARP